MMLNSASRSTFQTLLDALALRLPGDGQPAIIYVESGRPDVHVSRRHFRETSQRFAIALARMGVKPRDLVVIAHTQDLESIYAFWGALLIGAIPAMFPTLTEKLDPGIYMQNMAELAQISGVGAILTTDDFAASLDPLVSCPVYGSEQLIASLDNPETHNFQPHRPDPDEIAFLQHSSGTTGLQKGVALSHAAVLNQLTSYGEAIRMDARDVIVSWLPLYHDMGLIAGFILPLIQGIPLVLMSPFDWVRHPALLFKAIDDHRGTLCWLPNFAYNHCARRVRQRDTEGLSLDTMRLFINCSEPVFHESHQMFLERYAANGLHPKMLSVSYAMAENTFGVTQTVPGKLPTLDRIDREVLQGQGQAQSVEAGHPQAVTKVSCGPPIEGTAVRVLDENGRVLPERKVGELAIRSDCMLTEYYRRPDLVPFQDGWFMTGDMGYLAEGEVYIVGRSKDLIINAGKNIYPQDLEAIVNEVPGVHRGRAVVFGVPDLREGTELIAVLAETATEDPAEHKIIAGAIRRAMVAQSMVTATYVKIVGPKWLIKTSSGKIARAANRDKWMEEMGM